MELNGLLSRMGRRYAQQAAAPRADFPYMRGVWLSFLEYGWMLTGQTEAGFRGNVAVVMDRIVSLGLNTVVAQVRAHGDAFYPSEYFPWAQEVSGRVGQGADYDPLAILVEQAHARGLSLQAWVNPYRLMTDAQMAQIPERYAIRRWFGDPAFMVQEGAYWYLNPGNAQVQALILDGVRELVARYDVDGVQIDDYFYVPAPARFGHNEAQARGYTSAMVRAMYQTIKSVRPAALFGVSPAGNFDQVPDSDLTQFTDLVTWCTTPGYMDYVAPQIYWSFEDPQAPFETVLRAWEALCANGPVALVVGLAAYRFAGSQTLRDQVTRVERSPVARGYIYFRYEHLAPL